MRPESKQQCFNYMHRKPDIIWQNLLDDKCPKCGNNLHYTGSVYSCGIACGFVITAERYFEVRGNLEKKSEGKIMGVKEILGNGKVKFKSAKTFKGEQPAQPFNWSF